MIFKKTTKCFFCRSMLDIMLADTKKNDGLLGVVGVENDCKEIAALAQAYDASSLLVVFDT